MHIIVSMQNSLPMWLRNHICTLIIIIMNQLHMHEACAVITIPCLRLQEIVVVVFIQVKRHTLKRHRLKNA